MHFCHGDSFKTFRLSDISIFGWWAFLEFISILRKDGLENEKPKNTIFDTFTPNLCQLYLKNRIFLLSFMRFIDWCVI